MQGQILVISGPSGSGKSSLISRLLKEHKDSYFSISSTTRKIRQNETDGIHYHFVSKDNFLKGIENKEFIEWAIVHENYYGTSLKPCEKALRDGKIVIFDIDVQGFNIAKKICSHPMTSIFITTKTSSELKNRLCLRGTDNMAKIEQRLINARTEMKESINYDYLLLNDDLNDCYDKLNCIYKTLRYKTNTNQIDSILKNW